jgi:hypothetical protein
MLIELNGLNFHLEILPGSSASGPCARIADERFNLPPVDCPVNDVDCVIGLIERIYGVSADETTRRKIADVMAAQPAPEDFRVETGFEPHVLFLMT